MPIPNNITREHILRALDEIKCVPPRRRSKDYCIIYGGIHYPPKYVISIANIYANGVELSPYEFYGGVGPGCANLFLERRGFEVTHERCGCRNRDLPDCT